LKRGKTHHNQNQREGDNVGEEKLVPPEILKGGTLEDPVRKGFPKIRVTKKKTYRHAVKLQKREEYIRYQVEKETIRSKTSRAVRKDPLKKKKDRGGTTTGNCPSCDPKEQ